MPDVSLSLDQIEYPLTVVDGTSLTLVLNGPQGPAGVADAWLPDVFVAPPPEEGYSDVEPTSDWWNRIVECAYDVSLPFDASEYTGKRFILRTTAEIGITFAYSNDEVLTTIPAPIDAFGSTLTLIQSIGGVWMATINYTGVGVTIDTTITDGSTNAVSGNAVFDALALKAPLFSPTFTGTVSGITSSMVGLGNVSNTSDANKPVSTAQQTALDAKASKREYKTANFTAVAYGRYHLSSSGTIVVNNPTGTPTEGDMFDVLITSGNATINNTTYAASRFPIEVIYASGAWITPAANVTGTLAATTVSTSGDSVMNGVAFGRGSGVSSSSQYNTAGGRDALKNNTTGQFNSAFGLNSLVNNTTGSVNTAMGYYSLLFNTSGNNNTAIGVNSIFYNTSGSGNTAIGANSIFYNTSGGGNTAAGVFSLLNNTTGSNNTATGINSLYNNVVFSNATGIGSNTQVSASNQVQLGDSATTTYAYGALQNRSDIRDKADVRDTLLGLDFISLLRPVDYKWDMREDYRSEMPAVVLRPSDLGSDATEEDTIKYAAELAAYESYLIVKDEWLEASKLSNIVHNGSKKRSRYHHGLIAQEVKAVLDEHGMDFGGFQDHQMKGGDDVFSIGYAELIAPLIKSIQQLKARVEYLESLN